LAVLGIVHLAPGSAYPFTIKRWALEVITRWPGTPGAQSRSALIMRTIEFAKDCPQRRALAADDPVAVWEMMKELE
jgi:hypothetical protein